jgi:streptogramin lyase
LNNTIGRMTTSGDVTNFADPGIWNPKGIVSGPDGALWFTNWGAAHGANGSVGRITTSGVFSYYRARGVISPVEIADGPDGALWFANYFGRAIGRITTAGQITLYRDISYPLSIAAGPDGAMWFASSVTSTLGRITTAVTPAIRTLRPVAGMSGRQVTISGRNLAGATEAAFNGVAATIVSDTETQLVAVVPPGATSGPVSITTAAGTATSARRFRVA